VVISHDPGHEYEIPTWIAISLFLKLIFFISSFNTRFIKDGALLFFIYLLYLRIVRPHDPGRRLTILTLIDLGFISFYFYIKFGSYSFNFFFLEILF
jgi:hypothetical protein